MTDLKEAIELARLAYRDDIAGQIIDLGELKVAPLGQEEIDLNISVRPNKAIAELTRWDLPTGPVWAMTLATVDWGGGDADVSENIVVTEYDLSDPTVKGLVLAVVYAATSPSRFVNEWAASNTQPRLRGEVDAIEQMAVRLGWGLRGWVDAVSALRLVDPRPLKPPMMGWRSL